MTRQRHHTATLERSETQIQRQFVKYLRGARQELTLWTALPLGGKRPIKVAAAMVAEGANKGAPDIMFFHRTCEGWPGLALEFKAANGRVMAHQARWHEDLRREGWVVSVVRSFDAAVEVVERHYGTRRDRLRSGLAQGLRDVTL